mmetsp:Transcript_50526/g.105552  ORF Transcript_50526/g.105552 Transcript_50526/m.105552 type:complete len:82 (+) Transcript_50526:539-784(+)
MQRRLLHIFIADTDKCCCCTGKNPEVIAVNVKCCSPRQNGKAKDFIPGTHMDTREGTVRVIKFQTKHMNQPSIYTFTNGML